ncbi:TetR/AcrR family transcriptional regulator C-terminal domain-containing protein [Tenggerimyces flavus]|uniref:TetR/AcrR family transcriptional regulator C-terminal domain-containing protein n=1 Tax=Tenggerimyces flavus TaxID=1708749 RepID=A0ABV7Y6C1_9ACTN|nr:TetR/AcrR family transcriptional regulator C-terminal domain-containing protein [Tenggerimyces flavus]MBM7785090.1 AcrR family transcriptional regulator [Tenggerimyces flavus]
MAEPPYARIVAALRERIESGALAPGDRVPSTRQLARQWDVALATATKAMTTLQQLGLVEAVPRVGTVVAAKPGRERRAVEHAGEPSRARILRTAIALADAEGLAAVSMRAVAAKLDVATMTLYRYVESKDALVALMVDAVYGEISYPTPWPDGWRERFEVAARHQWQLYVRHPWLPHVGTLGRPLPSRNLTKMSEYMLSAVERYDLGSETAMYLQAGLYTFVRGVAVNLESEALAAAETGLTQDEWMTTQERGFDELVNSGEFPAFARVINGFGPEGFDFLLENAFEFGLRAYLDGLAGVIERPDGRLVDQPDQAS